MPAWGIYNKVKKVLSKAVKTVNDNLIKPVASVAKTAANAIIPGSGGYIDIIPNFVDNVSQGNMTKAVGSAVGTALNTNKNIVRNAVSTIGNAAKNIGSVASTFVGNSVTPLSMVSKFLAGGRNTSNSFN